jgi:NitT/TauT family transport system permease protein
MTSGWKHYLVPNAHTSARAGWLIIAAWITLAIGWWTIARPAIFPSPLEVLAIFPTLWIQDGLGQELLSSMLVSVEAILLSICMSLPLAYVCRVPVFRPVGIALAKLRFVSPAIFYSLLVYALHSGHQVKTMMLALGETFFLITTMMGVVEGLPEYLFDDARTLRMSPWKSVWYVIIRGTLPQAIDAIRDNQAMGWSMLMMVEGFVRSEGGVGVMIISNEKFMSYAAVYAIAVAIVVVGIAQDYLLGVVKQVVCPYAV